MSTTPLDPSIADSEEPKVDPRMEYEEKQRAYEETEERRANPPGTNSTVLTGGDIFEYKGFQYKIGPITLKIEAKFEQWCERNEIQGIERRQSEVTNFTYSVLMSAYLDRLGSRHWSWSGIPSIQARNTVEGMKALKLILLTYYNPPHTLVNKPAWTEAEMNELWNNDLKWAELKAKIDRFMDPNPTAPPQEAEPQ